MMEQRSLLTLGDGTRVAYRLDGEPYLPVLVLSNSIGTALEMWTDDAPEFARHFRVLRYDMRGHVASDVPAGAYSLARLGRDVVEMMDVLGIERAHFLGLSLGGFVGQWLGIHAPERIDRLILSNTSSYLGPAKQIDERIASVREPANLSETAETFLRNWFPPSMLRDREPVVETFREVLLAMNPHGIAASLAAVRDADLRRTISLIERPTLVIAGRDDTVTAASHGELIAATIPGARLVVLPAVHLPNVERPREFREAVLEFLLSR
jgi:3-oxoadipate enol-lactonase